MQYKRKREVQWWTIVFSTATVVTAVFLILCAVGWSGEVQTVLSDPHAIRHSERPAPQSSPIPQPSHSLKAPPKIPIQPPSGVVVLQTPQRSLTKKDSYQTKGGVE